MEELATYLEQVNQAVTPQDVEAAVALIEDTNFPFWMRREGMEVVMSSPDDEFAMTIFNRLFLPIEKAELGDTPLLVDWWNLREERERSPVRRRYLRTFLRAASGYRGTSDRTHNVAVSLLAAWSGQSNTLAEWGEVNSITKRFLATYVDIAPERLVDPRLLRAALWSGDLGLMQGFAALGVQHASTQEQRLMTHYLVSSLTKFGDRTVLRPLSEAMHASDPRHPIAIHNLAQVDATECRDAAEIAELYRGIDSSIDPTHFRMTVNWIAQHCYEHGYKDRAAALFSTLGASTDLREVSWSQKILGGAFSQEGQASVDYACPVDLLGLAPIFARPLQQVAQLIQSDMTWSGPLGVDALVARFDEIVERIDAIPRTVTLLGEAERVAQQMILMSQKYFECQLHFVDASPIPFSEKYGRIDMARMAAMRIGLNRVAATAAGIGLEALFDGAPIQAMERCLQLLDYFVGASLAAGGLREALAMLHRFERFEACRDFVRGLVERCLLAEGDVKAAWTRLSPQERRRSAIFEVVDRDPWTAAEGLDWETLVDDPQTRGHFEVGWSDGRIEVYDHVVPAVRVALARPGVLTIRRGEMLRGRKDLVVRPKRTHFPIVYPDRMPEIVAQGACAVRLLRLGAVQQVAEPTLVLECFDAVHHRNYYHWLIFLLTRLNDVKALGLLDGRRVVMPEGLSPWMWQTCRAIGIDEAAVLIAKPEVELCLTDALLVSSVEFASPTMLRSLCATLLPAWAEPEVPQPPVYLYLSRRGQTRRPFFNEPRIEDIACELGFTIVQPEKLPFVEQVRLFRQASGVAGAEGAAFANTIFCRPGTRILTLLNENDLFPVFNDIATIMNLEHRKLAGEAALDEYGVNYLWGGFSIDEDLAVRDLKWVLGG